MFLRLGVGDQSLRRTIKLKLYRRRGVAAYWIVDPDAKGVYVWVLAAGATAAKRYTDLPVRLAKPGLVRSVPGRTLPPIHHDLLQSGHGVKCERASPEV